MNPLIIEIYDENVANILNHQSKKLNISPTTCALDMIKKYIIANPQTIQELSVMETLISDLKNKYAEQYKLKFGLEPSRENGDVTESMEDIISLMISEIKDIETTKSLLTKAIIWYIHFHDNTSSEGTNFPYGLKYLFSKKNTWLLRNCIESSQQLDSEMFRLMESGLSKDEATRTLRRGDSQKSGKQESIAEHLQEAQSLYNEILSVLEGTEIRQKFRFAPQVDLLFKSDSPSTEYINDAIVFLKQIKNVIMEGNKN